MDLVDWMNRMARYTTRRSTNDALYICSKNGHICGYNPHISTHIYIKNGRLRPYYPHMLGSLNIRKSKFLIRTERQSFVSDHT